jgi:peptidoglycan/xylan/chitin deacetylase (PgdA/CDA1 family)
MKHLGLAPRLLAAALATAFAFGCAPSTTPRATLAPNVHTAIAETCTLCRAVDDPRGIDLESPRAPAHDDDGSTRERGAKSASDALASKRPPTPAATPSDELAAPGAACAAPDARASASGLYASDPARPGEIVLTFDDGPHPTGTPRVLDQLGKRGMKATFFVVGRAIDRTTYPIVQRIVREGHTLGSHTFSHDVRMTKTSTPERTIEDIVGQHEVTAVLIDLALLATSGDDFDTMWREVFASKAGVWLKSSVIREDRARILARHRGLLEARGYTDGARPYAVLYARPPGGGPYVEHDGAAGMALYDEAMRQLGMVNVMWHDASGDTVPVRRSELGFLTANLARAAKKGGVVLVHDYIRGDALDLALDAIARDPAQRVVPMQSAIAAKYGCESAALAESRALAAAPAPLGRGFVPLRGERALAPALAAASSSRPDARVE